MNIVRCEAIADFSGKEDFGYISTQHPKKASGKDDDSLVHRMGDNCRGSSNPKYEYSGIK